MSKSLTRTVDDVDRDAMLKNQVNMVAIFMIFDNNDFGLLALGYFKKCISRRYRLDSDLDWWCTNLFKVKNSGVVG